MKPICALLLVILANILAGCQHSPGPATVRVGVATEPTLATAQAPTEHLSGTLMAIDLTARVVRVKVVFRSRVMAVAPECEIITATSPRAALGDLQVGDMVDIVYTPHAELPVAQRMAVKGVTPDEREAARDAERLERILTPSPTER